MDSAIKQLSETIRDAAAHKRPLRIRGGGTKDFYGGEPCGEVLDVTGWRGIVEYEPTELVITARAGTPLAEIEAALREKGQMLAFEPPHFGEIPSTLSDPSRASRLSPSGEENVVPPERRGRIATLGGCVAAGLSGPRRAYAGAVRDFVLGVRLLDGRGDELRFGGRVMKNVAGYDVSRLMAGSLGTLGVLLEVSLKVLPAASMEATVQLACAAPDAIALMNEWARRPLPITATAFRSNDLAVRLSGARPAVEAAKQYIAGDVMEPEQADRFWIGIREQTDRWFQGGLPLWRMSVKSTAPPIALPGERIIEWGGALRWLQSDAAPVAVRDAAKSAGGHATLFRGGDRSAGAFHPLPGPLMNLHQRLKRTFDPAGILNPGRMYADW